MFRVGIIGPESTGKSTLATYLAERYDAGLVPEYAREYMESLAPSYVFTSVCCAEKRNLFIL